MLRSLTSTLTISLLLSSPFTQAQQVTDSIAPEQSSGLEQKQLVTAKDWMVTAANPLATQAGADILAQGGNAVDAMVAVQLMLGLVEPQSSGIGGGAFLVYWDAKKQALTTFDGRETAPINATPELFLDKKGEPLSFYDAVVGGRSVATPGTVMLLWQVHERYGKLDWKKLIEPVISLAEKGFVISPRLASSISHDASRLNRYKEARDYFFDKDGKPKQAGTVLKNSAYAATLKKIAKHGASAFYHGDIAKHIVSTVNNAPSNPGVLSIKDLHNYQIKQREPICSPYQSYQICGMGPPSSGALTVGQILSISEHFDLKSWGPNNVKSWQVIADASRLAFADRGMYIADQDFVPMPTQGLLNQAYLKDRAKLINLDKALQTVSAGSPPWDYAHKQSTDESIELPSTSHFNIVDRQGNVVSMTTTIENSFGSRLMVGGFLLNNELTDFSFRTHQGDRPIANRIEPGKRPRSSMAPTIILKDGKPYIAIGSPGGSRIIGYVAQAIIAHVQWGMDIQQAIDLPHILSRFNDVEIEQNSSAVQMQSALSKLGYQTKVGDLNSGLHAIRILPNQLQGAADPRREGVAIGQ